MYKKNNEPDSGCQAKRKISIPEFFLLNNGFHFEILILSSYSAVILEN